jgi:ribonuclease PH
MSNRPSGRAPSEMRAISFETDYTVHAAGSVLASFGETRVLCTACVEENVPHFLRGKGSGWITGFQTMKRRGVIPALAISVRWLMIG